MTHPILKNTHMTCTQELPTPTGNSVTVRPGEYVLGRYFVHLAKPGFLEEVEVDPTTIKLRLIKYEQT